MPGYEKTVHLSGKTSQELYAFISREIDRFLEKVSIGKFELNRNDSEHMIHVKSSVFTGSLSCGEGFLELKGNLSLMALPFKSKLDEGIERWLKKNFSNETTS